MKNLEEILETLRVNEEVAQKFFEIEVSILSILKFGDLFEKLLAEIREKFAVPYVWITMIRDSELSDLIDSLDSSLNLRECLNILDRATFLGLIEHRTSPVLVNGDLTTYHSLLPKGQMHFIRSLAIAPLTFHGEIIGSLNQADLTRLRYRPGMDARLLERLAVKVSICLSNVTAHERLQWLAARDPLTKLLNRRVMATILQREFKRAQRYKSSLSLAFLDLDDFKAVNDRFGHDGGDALLKYVARRLSKMTRDTDIVVRYGGDEFVIILPGVTGEEVQNLIHRLRAYFDTNPLKVEGISIPVSISYGVSSLPDSGTKDPAALLSRADEMLYHAKTRKREHRPQGGE
jgi:diguanylate cyclase (GGDEF)-like protein